MSRRGARNPGRSVDAEASWTASPDSRNPSDRLADIPHEKPPSGEVVGQKAQSCTSHGEAEDKELVVPAQRGQDCQPKGGQHRNARGQAVHPIQQIHGVGPAH